MPRWLNKAFVTEPTRPAHEEQPRFFDDDDQTLRASGEKKHENSFSSFSFPSFFSPHRLVCLLWKGARRALRLCGSYPSSRAVASGARERNPRLNVTRAGLGNELGLSGFGINRTESPLFFAERAAAVNAIRFDLDKQSAPTLHRHGGVRRLWGSLLWPTGPITHRKRRVIAAYLLSVTMQCRRCSFGSVD